jgi:hypothetical protein
MSEMVRIADSKGRVCLPRFANATVIIEAVTECEYRVRRARVIPEDELRSPEEHMPKLVEAQVQRDSDYADGVARVTLAVLLSDAGRDWPVPPAGKPQEVELVIGPDVYTANLRVDRVDPKYVPTYVYVCAPLKDSAGQKRRLADVLQAHGLADVRPFTPGQRVQLRLDETRVHVAPRRGSSG